MLKTGVITKDDIDESIKLARRKIYEDARKKRIFNSKARSIGLDKAALERQIFERKVQENTLREWEKKMEEQTARQNMAIFKQWKDEEKRVKEIAKEVDYFRCRFQRPEMRSEYDLNDPNALRKQKPLRSGTDDINLGISSAQIFEGEDMGKLERDVRQRAQQRSWLQQQMQERKNAIEDRVKAEKIMDETAFSMDQKLSLLAFDFEKRRQQAGQDINNFNNELARIKRDEKLKQRKMEEEDNMAEICNMLNSDLLSEKPVGGLSPTELRVFKDQQEKQLLEKRKQREDFNILEKEWEQYANNVDRELRLKELELERQQKLITQECIDFNLKLAEKQKAARIRNNEILGFNRMSDEFYDQFNKNSR